MGFIDRLHSIVTATGGAITAPLGFAKDITMALPELGTLDLPDFAHDVYKAVTWRGGQELGALAGPEGILGNTLGQLPGHQAVGQAVQPFQSGMDYAYHELVGQPLASAVTAGTFAQQDGIGALFRPETYAESYNIAEHRSPGQSLALAFLTKDIRDPHQVEKAQGTDWYQAISGTTDAVSRTLLDPTAIGLGYASDAIKAARAVDTAADIERLTMSGEVGKFVSEVSNIVADHGDGASAVIRHTYFPRHMAGAQISDLLARAHTLPPSMIDGLSGEAAVERVTRILMGAPEELDALRSTRADLGGQIDRLMQRQSELKVTSNSGFELANAPEDLAATQRELNSLYTQHEQAQRLTDAWSTIDSLPRTGGAVAARGRFTLGDFYQNSLFAKPLHTVFDMEPHPWIHLDDPHGDISLWRQLEKSPLPLDERLSWRSKYMAAQSPAEKAAVASAAEESGTTAILRKATGVDLESQGYDEIAKRIAAVTREDPEDVARAARYAEKGGMSKADFERQQVQPILDKAAEARGVSQRRLDSIAYDGEDRAMIQWDNEHGITQKISVPLYETQLPNLHATVDFDKLKDAVSPIQRFLERNPLHDVAPYYIDKFASVWKPAVLLRPGFSVRFLTDESLRSMSRIGVLATSKNIGLGGYAQASEWRAKLDKLLGLHAGLTHEEIGAKIADWIDADPVEMRNLATAAAERGTPKAEFVKQAAENFGLGRSEEAILMHPIRHVVGMNPVDIAGHPFGGAFGAPGDLSNIQRKFIQARQAWGSLVDEDQGRMMEHLIQSGPWRSVAPTEKAYKAAWEHAVNNQIGKSKLGAKLLELMQGPTKAGIEAGAVARTPEEIVASTVDWLKNDPEGQALAKKLPVRKDLDGWVRAAHDQIDAYLPTDELKAAAWNGSATHDMLAEQIPNAAARPNVHGGVVSERMGGPIGQAWRSLVDTAMTNMVAKPSNVLIRQPFFDHMYQAELARQVRLLTGEEQLSLTQRMARFVRGESTHAAGDGIDIAPETMRQMEVRARRYAQGQTKDLFHDFSEESSFAKSLGFLSPFANAYGQIMSRWAGIAVDNPAFIRRLQIIWRSPERAGLVTDGAGNVLDEHDKIVTPARGGAYKVGDDAADTVRHVHIHAPSWVTDIPGLGLTKNLTFNKADLNLLVHGLPPVGPVVQIAVNEIAKQRPDLADSLKWALPYGTTQNSLEILEPTVLRRAQTLVQKENSRDYAYSLLRIYNDRITDYALGKRPTKPTYEEVKKDNDAYWKMRTATSIFSPVSPQLTSPYQPYIDMLQNRRDLDAKLTPEQRKLPSYQTPDEWFLDKVGDEFFALTTSLSKSIDGIPPTVEGKKIHDAHAKILAEYPELGSLIAGAEGAGKFSQGVYDSQFVTDIGPGSAQKEREVEPFATYKTKGTTAEGWRKFGDFMDTLDAVLHQRGLPSYGVKAAGDLAAAKAAYVEYLANDPKYTGWFDDYMQTDEAKWDHRIAGMTKIVQDPTMVDRPEFQGLRLYLAGRKEITAILKQLGSKRLDTQANAGLLAGWDGYVQHLVESNVAFADLYHRWLQNDPVTISPITAAAQAGTLAP